MGRWIKRRRSMACSACLHSDEGTRPRPTSITPMSKKACVSTKLRNRNTFHITLSNTEHQRE
jgi:hypothetical protein